MKTLQDQITALQSERQSIADQRDACRDRYEQALTRCVQKIFTGVISENVSVTATYSAATFSMLDDDCRKQDIFQIYFDENYSGENKYKDLNLSYYTTRTNSQFELDRLYNLGRVALTVKEMRWSILDQLNQLGMIYKFELGTEKFYDRENEVSRKINELNHQIAEQKKNDVLNLLLTKGITFEKAAYIDLKVDYRVWVKSIKFKDISKSGKTGVAVFSFMNAEHLSREENINIKKILDQVIRQYKIS